MIRTLVTLVGFACLAIGLLWVGQGLDLIRWPADSFMIGQGNWTLRGATLALAGILLIWFARRT